MRGLCGCRRDARRREGESLPGPRRAGSVGSLPPSESAARLARRCRPGPAAPTHLLMKVCARGQLGVAPPPLSPPPAHRPAGRDAGGRPHAPRPAALPRAAGHPLSPAGSLWSAACSSRPWSRSPPHSARSPRVDTAGPPLPALPPEAVTEQLPGPPLPAPTPVFLPPHFCSRLPPPPAALPTFRLTSQLEPRLPE